MKVGLFVGRMNPPHLGHIKIIEKSLKENDQTIIILGSIDKLDNLNPLSYEKRKFILEHHLMVPIKKGLIHIKGLKDNKSDRKWVINISKIIKDTINEKIEVLSVYGGELDNDFAIDVLQKFDDHLKVKKVEYIEVDRNILKINLDGEKTLVSSTTLRDKIRSCNHDHAKLLMGEKMYKGLLK